MDATLQKTLDKAWNSTCKVLLGQEIGPMSDYREWLEKYQLHGSKRKSSKSGKDVWFASGAYPANARVVSADELEQNKGYSLSINQIKDIDSILQAISEQYEYTGNRYLGNCAFIDSSDQLFDAQYVHNSTNVQESMYVSSSFMIRKGSKYVFGSGFLGESEFMVRVVGTYNCKRALECYFMPDCSDAYFSHSCYGCHDIMFCFGKRSAMHAIGNLALPKEKYLQLKKKLLAEIAGWLMKEKDFPALFELVPAGLPKNPPSISAKAEPPGDMKPVEEGFASTCRVVLKKELPGSIQDYEKWLSENTVLVKEAATPFGGETVYPEEFTVYPHFPAERRTNIREMMALGKTVALQEKEVESLKSVIKALPKIAYFTSEFEAGDNFNNILSICFHAVNSYKVYDATYAENNAFGFMALHSKFTYGCNRPLETEFAIKCYNSVYLKRCLELDSCEKCADTYFSHNCEALSDCMFCFNLKGRRNHIGNTEFPKEKYAAVKDAVLEQVVDELSRKKKLALNIYNVGEG